MNSRLRTVTMSLSSLSLAGLFLIGLGVSLARASNSATLTRLTSSRSFDRTSFSPSISADGTRVAFDSNGDFLNQDVSFDQREIWLYDLPTLTLTRVTTTTADRRSCCVSVNANGTRIAFLSDADLLNQGIPPGQREVWLYDTTTLTFTRLTTSPLAYQQYSPPKLSADGTQVFFHSNADLLHPGNPTYQYEIWRYDTTAMTVTRLTASGNGRASLYPSVNAAGTGVVFHSNADFFNQGIPFNQYEIWLYDTTTLTVTRLTTSSVANRYSLTRPSVQMAQKWPFPVTPISSIRVSPPSIAKSGSTTHRH